MIALLYYNYNYYYYTHTVGLCVHLCVCVEGNVGCMQYGSLGVHSGGKARKSAVNTDANEIRPTANNKKKRKKKKGELKCWNKSNNKVYR